jgi:stage V sporulation protein B
MKGPLVALLIGLIVKTILNFILVRNENLAEAGASLATVIGYGASALIALAMLNKEFDLKLSFGKVLFKPLLAGAIMGGVSFFSYIKISEIMSAKIATLIGIVIAVVVYSVCLLAFKVFTKSELSSLPVIGKIYQKMS